MQEDRNFEVIIIGGSYAGLSAAMALGRALRKVLVIDSGLPCNRQTPHSHNFITQDGEKPAEIAARARAQVLKYNTVSWIDARAVHGKKIEEGFVVTLEDGSEIQGGKLVFATGLRDIMPDIPGFGECWGISLIHCPYCHGYEVKNEKTGILANGEAAFHYAQLIWNWTKDLTIFTNGPSTLTPEQAAKIRTHRINIVENEIARLDHENGHLKYIVFNDQTTFSLKAVYTRPEFQQHCSLPEELGCEFTGQGLVKTDMFQKTNIDGVYACGDSASMMRSVSNAVASGGVAGAVINNELVKAEFDFS